MILIQVGNEIINIEPGLYTAYCGASHISITFDPATRREPLIISGAAGLRIWRALAARAIICIEPDQMEARDER